MFPVTEGLEYRSDCSFGDERSSWLELNSECE